MKRVNSPEAYCCISLLRAVENGFLTEVVSGIILDRDTGSDKPFANFCPFCGSKITYTGNDGNHSWCANEYNLYKRI